MIPWLHTGNLTIYTKKDLVWDPRMNQYTLRTLDHFHRLNQNTYNAIWGNKSQGPSNPGPEHRLVEVI